MKKGAIRSEFSDAARSYDQYAVVQSYVFDTLTSLIVDNQPRRILDIGCGTGLHTARLAARFPDAEITAIDMSDQMIEVASQQVLAPNIRFEVADADDYRPTDAFDLMIANASLHWLSDLSGAVSRLSQGLVPGGQAVMSLFGPQTFHELRGAISAVLGREILLASGYFLEGSQIQAVMADHFPAVDVKQELIRQPYESLSDLLKSIKYTGTRGDGLPGRFWTPKLMREIESAYRARVRHISATYQVFYCVCRRG